MFEQIISLENLLSAWNRFKCGKRRNEDVQLFERHLEDNLFRLNYELKTGIYKHRPYQMFQIFDPKHRIIHKAEVRDRVMHHAIYRVLEPIFEPSFIFDSYSCRVGKGTHKAVSRLETFTRKVSQNGTRTCWALKCDIRKFFNNIDHEILLKQIEKKISDKKTLQLVKGIISSFPNVDNFLKREREREIIGIPIGNLTSQLFANIYMNSLDHFAKEVLDAKYYLRYTDDFIFLHEDRNVLENFLPRIKLFLKVELNLELHPGKIQFRKLNHGIDFLGYIVFPKFVLLRDKTRNRMMKKLQSDMITKSQMSSYIGLLSHCEGYELKQQVRRLYLEQQKNSH